MWPHQHISTVIKPMNKRARFDLQPLPPKTTSTKAGGAKSRDLVSALENTRSSDQKMQPSPNSSDSGEHFVQCVDSNYSDRHQTESPARITPPPLLTNSPVQRLAFDSHHSRMAAEPESSFSSNNNDEHSHKRKAESAIVQETTRLKDIIGHGAVKLRIDELILPLGLPAAVADSVLTGIRAMPASILLYGPPGCGKTKLARAIAGEARAAFFPVSPSDILSKFVGESEASIRGLFCNAVEKALLLDSKCAVVFFDEIDALGQSRETSGAGEGEGCSRRVLTELLLQLNVIADHKTFTRGDFGGIEKSDKMNATGIEREDETAYGLEMEACTKQAKARILVVAATNRQYDCDSALLRRFGIQLEVGLPSYRDRQKMLSQHMAGVHHSICKRQLQYMAAITDEWSGSALEKFSREAAMAPVRDCIRKAAVLRRRAFQREQSRGHPCSSRQQEKPDAPDPDTEARNSLLEGFQKLRPVALIDFQKAFTLLTGENVLSFAQHFELQYSKEKADASSEHYDSSSGSDEGE